MDEPTPGPSLPATGVEPRTDRTDRAAREAPPPGPPAADAATEPPGPGPAAVTRSSVVRVALLAGVGAGVVGLAVHAAGSSVRSALEGLVEVHLWWVLPLVATQAVSMGALGHQQRALVAPDRERRPGMGSVLKTTYASNAISVSLPIAGPGLATAFTFRRYARASDRPGQVATGLAVSGVVSLSALVAIVAAAAVASGRTALLVGGVNALVLSTVPVLALVLALRSARARERAVRPLARLLGLVQRVVRRPRGDAGDLVSSAVRQLAEAELAPRQVTAAAVFALLTSVADVATLGFALAATGTTITWASWPLLVLTWATCLAAAGVGLVPGGVGVVEVAGTAVLTASGVPLSAALPGVLLYRIVAFWLVIAVGWVLASVRARQVPAPADPPAAGAGTGAAADA